MILFKHSNYWQPTGQHCIDPVLPEYSGTNLNMPVTLRLGFLKYFHKMQICNIVSTYICNYCPHNVTVQSLRNSLRQWESAITVTSVFKNLASEAYNPRANLVNISSLSAYGFSLYNVYASLCRYILHFSDNIVNMHYDGMMPFKVEMGSFDSFS